MVQKCRFPRCPVSRTCTASPVINTSRPMLPLLPSKNPLGHIIITQILQFTLWFTLGIVRPISLEKCTVTCIHQYSIITSNFQPPKSSVLCNNSYFTRCRSTKYERKFPNSLYKADGKVIPNNDQTGVKGEL